MSETTIDALVPSILQFFAADDERMARFFAMTGLTVDTIRDAAGRPGLEEAVMDHLLADERLLVLFADAEGIASESIAKARAALDAPAAPTRETAPRPTPQRLPSGISRRFAAG